MISGAPPFLESDLVATIVRHVQEPAQPIRQAAVGIDVP